MANELPKHNNYENSRLSAGLNLCFSLGHKVNDNSSVILNCCVLLHKNFQVKLNDRKLFF